MEKQNKLSNVEVLVIDNGQFHSFASCIAKDFKKVWYYTRWDMKGFAKPQDRFPGYGFPEISTIDYMFKTSDKEDEYDFNRIGLFIFTDLYFSDIQAHLVSLGKRVFGSRGDESLELDRWGFKKTLIKLGLPIAQTVRKKGLDALRNYLKTNNNKYIKISCYRGAFETFKHEDYSLTEPILDKLEQDFGALKNVIEFIVEDEIKTDLEVGYDGYVIDGQFPDNSMLGIETKDCSFIMKTLKYKDLPAQVRIVNTKLTPYFKERQYRMFFDTEIRVKGKMPYFTDPVYGRLPSPPSEIYQELISNLAEICYYGAEGILIEPEFTAKYAGELIITSGWLSDGNWQAIDFPDSIKNNVKLRYACMIDGKYYCIPMDMPEVGAIVATGNTVDEVIESLKYIASKIKGHDMTIKIDKIDKTMETIAEMEKKLGIKF